MAPQLLSYSGIKKLILMLRCGIDSEVATSLLQLSRLSQYTAFEDHLLDSELRSPNVFSIAGAPQRAGMDFTIPINSDIADASDNSLLFIEDLITPLLTLYNEYRFIDTTMEDNNCSQLCLILDQNPSTEILQNLQSSLEFPLFARRIIWDIFYNLSKVKLNSQRFCSHPYFLGELFRIYDGRKTNYCEPHLFQIGISILLNLREHVNLSSIELPLLEKFVRFFRYYLRQSISISFFSLPDTEVIEILKFLSYFLEFLLHLLFNDHAKQNCLMLEKLLGPEFCIDLITLSCQSGVVALQAAFITSQRLAANLLIALIKSSPVLHGGLISSPEFEMLPRMMLLSVIHTTDHESNAEIRRLRLLEFLVIVSPLATDTTTTTIARPNGDASTTSAMSQLVSASVPKPFNLQALIPYEHYLFALCLNKKEMSHLIAPLLRRLCSLAK
jgi:hypothetical protein